MNWGAFRGSQGSASNTTSAPKLALSSSLGHILLPCVAPDRITDLRIHSLWLELFPSNLYPAKMGTSSFFFVTYNTVIIITDRPFIPPLSFRLSLHFSGDNNSRIYCSSSSALFKNHTTSFFIFLQKSQLSWPICPLFETYMLPLSGPLD